MKRLLETLVTEDAGQDLIEYALVAALVGLGVILVIKGMSNSVKNSFTGVSSALATA